MCRRTTRRLSRLGCHATQRRGGPIIPKNPIPFAAVLWLGPPRQANKSGEGHLASLCPMGFSLSTRDEPPAVPLAWNASASARMARPGWSLLVDLTHVVPRHHGISLHTCTLLDQQGRRHRGGGQPPHACVCTSVAVAVRGSRSFLLAVVRARWPAARSPAWAESPPAGAQSLVSRRLRPNQIRPARGGEGGRAHPGGPPLAQPRRVAPVRRGHATHGVKDALSHPCTMVGGGGGVQPARGPVPHAVRSPSQTVWL